MASTNEMCTVNNIVVRDVALHSLTENTSVSCTPAAFIVRADESLFYSEDGGIRFLEILVSFYQTVCYFV
jgi:hypothetical protein